MWYYKSLGQELGPVPYAEIESLARNGELSPKDYIRPGRSGAWQRAGRISGLFPDDYEQEQARLKEAAAKIALSSQRLGEKAFVALQAQAAMPEAEAEAEPEAAAIPEAEPEPPAESETESDEDKPAQKSVKSRKALTADKTEKRREKSKKATKKSEDLAADLLSEFDEEEEPEERPARRNAPTRSAAPPPVESDAAMTSTRPIMSMPTPMPPTRSIIPPTPSSAVSGFKRAPRSFKFSLPFDGKQGIIAAAVVLVLAGGYFAPWGSLFGASPGPKLFERATIMWAKVKLLKDKKGAKESDWQQLETDMVTTINLHLAELRPYTRKNNLAASLYIFEKEGLQNILSKGMKATAEDFQSAEDYLQEAKKHMPKM